MYLKDKTDIFSPEMLTPATQTEQSLSCSRSPATAKPGSVERGELKSRDQGGTPGHPTHRTRSTNPGQNQLLCSLGTFAEAILSL